MGGGRHIRGIVRFNSLDRPQYMYKTYEYITHFLFKMSKSYISGRYITAGCLLGK